MCGIVGMVIKPLYGFTSQEANTFEQMLYIDALRGDDGTGVASFFSDGSGQVIKEATIAAYFLYTSDWTALRTDLIKNGKAVIGHNRKKTIGKESDETSHPFVIDNRYMFVHNGTLHNHKKLFDTEVDSEALGMHLARCEGDPRKLEKALEEVDGAYACAWIDKEKEILYLLRNKDRPLVYGMSSNAFFFASEPAFIAAAAGRNYTKIDKYETIKDDVLYSIDLSKSELDIKEEALTITKKSYPTMPIKHGGWVNKGNTKAVTIDYTEGVSKNYTKRFQKKAVGQTIEFWCDDFVEATVEDSNTPLDNIVYRWMVMGEDLKLDAKHLVKGFIKCSYAEVKQIEGSLCTGKITSIGHNNKQKTMEIVVENIQVKNYEHALH